MDDLLQEFLAETSESLEALDGELVRLEQNPNDPELLSSIFRMLHTIKGTCGFLGLPRLEAVAHAGENVLGKFRDGELEVTAEAISVVLQSIDCINEIVGGLTANGTEPGGDDGALLSRLEAAAAGELGGQPAEASEATDEDGDADPEGAASANDEPLFQRVGGISGVDAACSLLFDRVLEDDQLHSYFAGRDRARVEATQRDVLSRLFGGPDNCTADASLVPEDMSGEDFDAFSKHLAATFAELEVPRDTIVEIVVLVNQLSPAASAHEEETVPESGDTAPAAEPTAATEEETAPSQPSAEAKAEAKGKTATGDGQAAAHASQSIRVNVETLENLMTVVSELVLTRNQLLQILRNQADSEFTAPLQRLNQVTSELQESVMVTRMQPIGNAWAKLPRLIRDLSHDLGKKLEINMIGQDTELDRQVLELVRDPLTHMVRNSADHGIETPAERREAGKSETGTITLAARHEGGHIIVEISDDGRGISLDKVRAKALANGLASEADIEKMSDQQIQQFIFQPGFSTAAAVTSVSGRGVGMDVVRTNIERIGGTVELNSTEGRGSRFTIKIPLTLAIVSALIVECAGERFAVPQSSVIELVRTTSKSNHSLEYINGTPVLRLRDSLVPLVSLDGLLELDREDGEDDQKERTIIISQVGSLTFGILVDRVFDTEEIVVKPVAPVLRHLTLFSGNTILGDGSVIMILDPNGIASKCGDVRVGEQEEQEARVAAHQGGETTSLLLFRAGATGLKAVPLSLVARLEEIDLSTVEKVSDRTVVQYRDSLMPLITLDEDVVSQGEGKSPVLVFTDDNTSRGIREDRSMGIVVDQIIDIVEENLDLELGGRRTGVIGSAIVAGKAVDVVDTSYYLAKSYDNWFEAETETPFKDGEEGGGGKKTKNVLLVDDSAFFRNLLTPVLRSAGYTVTTAVDAEDALEICESRTFDLIISDIEMPGRNGFEFAQELRTRPDWETVPLVALSSHAAPQDIAHGREAGFNDYVVKFDRNALLNSLTNTLTGVRGAA